MGEIIQRVLQMFGKKEEPDSTEEAILVPVEEAGH